MVKGFVFAVLFIFTAPIGFYFYFESYFMIGRILKINTFDVLNSVTIVAEQSGGFADYFADYLIDVDSGLFSSLVEGDHIRKIECGVYTDNEHWYRDLAKEKPFHIKECYADINGTLKIYVSEDHKKALISYGAS